MAGKMDIVHLSNPQVRVLAHPLRARLLALLRSEGPQTATTLADKLDTNTGATSYHLRQLAAAGLVVEEERPGAGRRRWWRAGHDMSSWSRSQYDDDPDAAAAVDWLAGHQFSVMVTNMENWNRASQDDSDEWRDAGELSDWVLFLTAGRTREMLAELSAVVARYHQPVEAAPEPGARRVRLYVTAVPESTADVGGPSA
jgi:hypothetical protein